MGWDAFRLPAEQYAVKTGIHPVVATAQNIATFKRQIKRIGLSYDWDREISTVDSDYYRWTQWIFLKLFERGLPMWRKCRSTGVRRKIQASLGFLGYPGSRSRQCGGGAESTERVQQCRLILSSHENHGPVGFKQVYIGVVVVRRGYGIQHKIKVPL